MQTCVSNVVVLCVTRMQNLSKSSVAEARKIFKTGAEQAAESKYFWLNYLSFEMSQTGKTAEEHVQEVFDLIRTTSGLPVATIMEFGQRNLDFLIERGSSVQSYLQVEKAFSAPPPPPAESSRKREAEESPSPDTKRVKMDEHGDDQQVSRFMVYFQVNFTRSCSSWNAA